MVKENATRCKLKTLPRKNNILNKISQNKGNPAGDSEEEET